MAVITTAGETLIRDKIQAAEALNIDSVVFAYVDGLDYTETPDRTQELPELLDTLPVTSASNVNDDTVVYSVTIPSSLGTWTFNWMGLYSSEDETLIAVAYLPEQEKRATSGDDIGNVLTKNFAIEFTGAADVTGITIDAESWQIDYTARLRSMDAIQRNAMKAVFGDATFEGDAFKVVYSGGAYQVTAGSSVIGGLNTTLAADYTLTTGTLPQTVWLDVYQQRTMAGVENICDIILNDGTELTDYLDGDMSHTVIKVAVINSTSSIVDHRGVIVDSLSRLSMATENSRGLMLLASAVEVLAYEDEEKAVTPSTLGAAAKSTNAAGKIVKRDDSGNFSAGTITATLSGNATSATRLQTARTIGGVEFNGTENINLPGVNQQGNQNTSGNAGTATRLATARNIGGVAFDGSENINLPGVNQQGNQNTSGNAATATKLQTARSITLSGDVSGSVTFDGSQNRTLSCSVANDSHTHSASTITAISNAVVRLAISTSIAGAVGTLALAQRTSGGETVFADMVSGAYLKTANVYGSIEGPETILSGTWRCMGMTNASSTSRHEGATTLWLRIS